MTDDRPALVIRPLRTDRLDLTPLDPAGDARSLHEMLADPEVHRYDIDARVSGSIAETESRLRLQVMTNGGASWAIRLRGGDAIGTIGVYADQGTTIRGVGWSLASTYWGQGITSDAARVVVPFLLGQAGVNGLEAWADSRNLGSVGVARAAGMSERGRLPRVYGDHVAQTVVMARAAVPADPDVLGVAPTLVVEDVSATVRLLQAVLGVHVAWEVGNPPSLVFLSVEHWSGSPGLRIAAGSGPVRPLDLVVDVGISVDVVMSRVARFGQTVVQEPANEPWGRREMAFLLPGGHLIRVSGPSSPRGAP